MTLSDNLKSSLRNETRLNALKTQTKLRSKTKRKKKYLSEKTEWRRERERSGKWERRTRSLNYFNVLPELLQAPERFNDNKLPEDIFMMQNTFRGNSKPQRLQMKEDKNLWTHVRLSYQSLNKLRYLSPAKRANSNFKAKHCWRKNTNRGLKWSMWQAQ